MTRRRLATQVPYHSCAGAATRVPAARPNGDGNAAFVPAMATAAPPVFVMTSSASTGGANKRACRGVPLRMSESFRVGSFNVDDTVVELARALGVDAIAVLPTPLSDHAAFVVEREVS